MSRSVADELLAGIAERDYERIASCFAPSARLRALTPQRLREEDGPEAIAARYRYWLDALEGFELVESSVTPVADRLRLLYRFRGRHPVEGPQENEHAAYAAVEGGRIVRLDLSCAGFRPTA